MKKQEPLRRAKIGLNKTDRRIIHERLTQLKTELEKEFESVCKRKERDVFERMNKTLMSNITRKYRIQLTAVNILISNLNYEKNEQNCKSFRKASDTSKRTTDAIANKTGITPSSRNGTRTIGRSNRVSIRRPTTEQGHSNVGGTFSPPSSSL